MRFFIDKLVKSYGSLEVVFQLYSVILSIDKSIYVITDNCFSFILDMAFPFMKHMMNTFFLVICVSEAFNNYVQILWEMSISNPAFSTMCLLITDALTRVSDISCTIMS